MSTLGGAHRSASKQAHSLVRNGTFITLTTIVTGALGYPFWAIATNRFDPIELGFATAAVALFSLIAQVADLGLSTTVVERLTRIEGPARRRRFVHRALFTALSAAIISTGCAFALSSFVLPTLASRLGVAGFVAGAMYAAMTVAGRIVDAVSVATLRADGMLRRNLATSLIKLLLFAAFSSSVHALLLVWAVAATVATAAQAGSLGLIGRSSGPDEWTDLAGSRRTSASHYLGNLGGELPMFVLPLLVLALGGPEVAGTYYVVAMFSIGLFMVSAAIAASMFAEASAARRDTVALTRQAMRIVVPIAMIAVVVTVLLADTALGFFDLSAPDDARLLLVVFAVSALPDGITNVQLAAWRARGRAFAAAVANTSMGIAALVITAVAFSSLGLSAVGVAWLTSQGVGCVLIAASNRRSSRRVAHRAATLPTAFADARAIGT